MGFEGLCLGINMNLNNRCSGVKPNFPVTILSRLDSFRMSSYRANMRNAFRILTVCLCFATTMMFSSSKADAAKKSRSKKVKIPKFAPLPSLFDALQLKRLSDGRYRSVHPWKRTRIMIERKVMRNLPKGIVIRKISGPRGIQALYVENTLRDRTWDGVNIYKNGHRDEVFLSVIPYDPTRN